MDWERFNDQSDKYQDGVDGVTVRLFSDFWPPKGIALAHENASLKARIEELEKHLGQALRQWRFYAEEHEERNLSDEKSLEGDFYRSARAALEAKHRRQVTRNIAGHFWRPKV